MYKREDLRMKTEQIILALEIAKTGSITKAAKNLFHSQPNASSALTSLENELGYELFKRSNKGAITTEKGKLFLAQAESMIHSLNNMMAIKEGSNNQYLRIISYNFPYCEKAFYKLAETHLHESDSLRLSYNTTHHTEKAVNSLNHGKADVIILFCSRSLYPVYVDNLTQKNYHVEKIHSFSINITMSKDHPLASPSFPDALALTEYPCIMSVPIKYRKQFVTADLQFALKKAITIDPGLPRLRLATENNGFIVSTPLSQEDLSKYNLVSYDIPDTEQVLFSVTRPDTGHLELVQEYVTLIKEYY
jgi:DNA-binding transcriptional LysR family regulator